MKSNRVHHHVAQNPIVFFSGNPTQVSHIFQPFPAKKATRNGEAAVLHGGRNGGRSADDSSGHQPGHQGSPCNDVSHQRPLNAIDGMMVNGYGE